MFDKTETMILPVDGMSCMHCAGRVEAALRGVKGVRRVKVDLEKKCAELVFVPAKAGKAEMKAAVVAAGFTVPEE